MFIYSVLCHILDSCIHIIPPRNLKPALAGAGVGSTAERLSSCEPRAEERRSGAQHPHRPRACRSRHRCRRPSTLSAHALPAKKACGGRRATAGACASATASTTRSAACAPATTTATSSSTTCAPTRSGTPNPCTCSADQGSRRTPAASFSAGGAT